MGGGGASLKAKGTSRSKCSQTKQPEVDRVPSGGGATRDGNGYSGVVLIPSTIVFDTRW